MCIVCTISACSGKCFEVRPAACEAYLPSNSTLWSASERELARASSSAATLQDLPKQTSMEEQCAARILELFCKWSMPICSVNATPTRVCKSSCDAVVDECASMWLQARSIIKEMESWDDCFDLHDTDGCVTVTQGERNVAVVVCVCNRDQRCGESLCSNASVECALLLDPGIDRITPGWQ